MAKATINTTKNMTTGQIAKLLDEPIHRVRRAIQGLGIEPTDQIAAYKLYSKDIVKTLKSYLSSGRRAI